MNDLAQLRARGADGCWLADLIEAFLAGAKPLGELLSAPCPVGTALHAVDHDPAAQFLKERFRAVIAYYPYCDISAATVTAPTLILIGEADETSPVEQCREMVAHARRDGAPIAHGRRRP